MAVDATQSPEGSVPRSPGTAQCLLTEHGFDHAKSGNLFFQITRLIEEADQPPSVQFLENVKHLVRLDGGNTFRVIKQTLTANLAVGAGARPDGSIPFDLPTVDYVAGLTDDEGAALTEVLDFRARDGWPQEPRWWATLATGRRRTGGGGGGPQKGNAVSQRSPLTMSRIAILALVLTGCGSSATSAGTAPPSTAIPSLAIPSFTAAPASETAQPTEAPTASPTEAPTEAPTAAVTAAPTPGPTDNELEALLPSTFMSVTLTKVFYDGTAPILGQFAGLATSLGKAASDASYAAAVGYPDVQFTAYRIKGVDASLWAPKLYALIGVQPTKISLGGKDVTKLFGRVSTDIEYAWTRSDVVFSVSTANAALAGDAIAAMP